MIIKVSLCKYKNIMFPSCTYPYHYPMLRAYIWAVFHAPCYETPIQVIIGQMLRITPTQTCHQTLIIHL